MCAVPEQDMTAAKKLTEGPGEHPILFSAPMVRAILEWRKTQTRRVVKEQPRSGAKGLYADRYNKSKQWAYWLPDNRMDAPRTFSCPYGEPDEKLWVKETFVMEWPEMDPPEEEEEFRRWVVPHYAATEPKPDLVDQNTERPIGWRPSIFMPRWASRITLELTAVRVERLQDISEEDAMAEGCDRVDPYVSSYGLDTPCRAAFAQLWDSINAERPGCSWEANPWVWALSFRRVGT
jgi:hypothetical protein